MLTHGQYDRLLSEAEAVDQRRRAALYCLLPQCERCPATRGLRAVRVTVDLPNASGISEPCPVGPVTMDGNCVEELRFRGFTVTTLASDELAPEFVPEVPV